MRKNPQTSHEAFAALTNAQLDAHHAKIIKCLEILGVATAEQISDYVGMEHVQINRRMIDLLRKGIAYRTGEKILTKKGRNAYQWCLCRTGATVTKAVTEKFPEGKASHEYSSSILQQSLF